jgi:hypothetical protein
MTEGAGVLHNGSRPGRLEDTDTAQTMKSISGRLGASSPQPSGVWAIRRAVARVVALGRGITKPRAD